MVNHLPFAVDGGQAAARQIAKPDGKWRCPADLTIPSGIDLPVARQAPMRGTLAR